MRLRKSQAEQRRLLKTENGKGRGTSSVGQRLRFLREFGCNGAFESERRGVVRIKLQSSVGRFSGRFGFIVSQIEAGENQESFSRRLEPESRLGLSPGLGGTVIDLKGAGESGMRLGVVGLQSECVLEFLFSFGHEALGEKFVTAIHVKLGMGRGIGRGKTLFGGCLQSHIELLKRSFIVIALDAL